MNNIEESDSKIKQYNGGCLNLFIRALLKDPQSFLNDTKEPLNIGGRKPGSTLYFGNLDEHKLYFEYSWQGVFTFDINIYVDNNNELCYGVDSSIRCGGFGEICDTCSQMEEYDYERCPRCRSSDIDIENNYCNSCPWREDDFTCENYICGDNYGIIKDNFEIELNRESNRQETKSLNLLKEINHRSEHPVFDNFIQSLLRYVKEKLNSQYPPEINNLILEYL